jgi:PAS domain S-box-containing protein
VQRHTEAVDRPHPDVVKDERLRVLFELSSDAIFVGLPDGVLTAVNAAACRLIGYTHEELLGMNARDLVAPEWLDIVDQHANLRLAGLEREAVYELAFVDRVGHRIPIEMRTTILEHDGQTVGMHAVVRDIRERHRARAALAESEQRFQSAFEAPLVGMALASLDRRLLKVNNALSRMLDYPETELLNRLLDDLAHPDDRAEFATLNLSMLAGEVASYQAQPRLRHSSGHYLPVQLNVSIFRDPAGQPAYTITQIIEQPASRPANNSQPCPLTVRELQVLTHLANGDSTAETAAALSLAHDTVHTYVRRATRKLGARTRTQTIVKAATSGWLDLNRPAA